MSSTTSALKCDLTDVPVVCMVSLVHAEITLDNHTLSILLDHNLVFPKGVLIGYAAHCQYGQCSNRKSQGRRTHQRRHSRSDTAKAYAHDYDADKVSREPGTCIQRWRQRRHGHDECAGDVDAASSVSVRLYSQLKSTSHHRKTRIPR